MPRVRQAVRAAELRLCLHCGHDGPELQGERGRLTFACRSCGADLYARPPRSYAEMEGLSGADADGAGPLGRWTRGESEPQFTPAPQAAEPDARSRSLRRRALAIGLAAFTLAALYAAILLAA